MSRLPGRLRAFASLAGLALLGGCMVGPDYKPAPPPPTAAGPFAEPTATAAPLPPRWWRLYADPTLDGLIEEALANNTDVRTAAANVKRARYALSEARAGLLPTTDASAQFTHTRQGTATLATQNPGIGAAAIPESFDYDLYSLGLKVSYELDLFGGVRRGIQAARGDYQATAATLDGVRVTVAADTVRAYGEACGYSEQIAAATESARLQARTLDLTERLDSGGRGTRRDVDQVRVLYEQSQASLASLTAERRAMLYALAVLTGQAPAALDPLIGRCATPPKLSQSIPTGDGAALLARRPDVRKAERQLAADTARIGVAVADLYPKISLLGSVASNALRAGDTGKSKALTYSFGPLISWSFPIQSVARARVHEAKATGEASLASFDGTVLTALKETEQALARLDGETRRNAALARAFAAAADAATLSRYRFDYGADSFLQLLDTERTRAAASASLAASNTALLDAQVDLFRALGGGWEQAPAVNEKGLGGKAPDRSPGDRGASPSPRPAPAPAG